MFDNTNQVIMTPDGIYDNCVDFTDELDINSTIC